MRKILGIHQSRKGGIHTIQTQMNALKTDTCAFFFGSPRSFASKPLTTEEIKQFKQIVKNPSTLLPHGSYLINLVNKDPKHAELFKAELTKCRQLGINLYNIHPGSDTSGIGVEKALDQIALNINSLDPGPIIVIENMAGDGKKLGYTFEHLRGIIDRVEDKEKVGVCLDTCHLFAAGYDIRTAEKFDEVMKQFDSVVGIKYLKGMHLNDSKQDLGSRKDRHELIGKGKIGIEAFKFIMQSHWFDKVSLIIETPDEGNEQEEIEMLRSFE